MDKKYLGELYTSFGAQKKEITFAERPVLSKLKRIAIFYILVTLANSTLVKEKSHFKKTLKQNSLLLDIIQLKKIPC